MKSMIKIAFSFLVGLCVVTACHDSDEVEVSSLSLGTREITLGAEGGTEIVRVTAGGYWTAKSNQPWVKVMPANGNGSVECEVVVDTTLANAVRHAVVSFVAEGQEKQDLQIHQTGYGKMIGLSEEEIKVANMGDYGKRYFEISVTTNVKFKVKIPSEASSWLSVHGTPSVDLDYGARPRTAKVRFNWEMNTDAVVREAVVSFLPLNEEDVLEKEVALTVKQDAAPEILDNRSGDSIALIIVREKTRAMTAWNTTEKMEYWIGVTLWEKTDKGVTPEMIGRVRSAEFRMMNTKEALPVELSKLKYVETLVFSGNTNTMLLPDDFTMGNALAELKYLKHLTVSAYGITTITPMKELKESRRNLETLDLSGNNFTELPYSISKSYFPKLTALSLTGMRRYSTVTDMQEGAWREKAGMKIDVSGPVFQNLLRWEELKELRLSYNYLYGKLPSMEGDWVTKPYTDAQIEANDTLKSATDKAFLKTVPRVFPNMERFSINLNFLTGRLPNWLLYHPRFARFDPFTLVITQDKGYDPSGYVPGFENEPVSLDYFYEFYPAAKPTKTE